MKILLTGATGYIGRAAALALAEDGHQITAARRRGATAPLPTGAAHEVTADLNDPPALVAAAGAHDATIHLAFPAHGTDWAASVATEAAAIRALAAALATRGGRLIVANGTIFLGPSGAVPHHHESPVADDHPAAIRARATAPATQTPGLSGAELRFASFVYGHGGSVFLPRLVAEARRSGQALVVGDGAARLSAVHVADAGRAVARVLATGAEGIVTVASDESPTLAELARAIAAGTGATPTNVDAEEAARRLDPFTASFLSTPNRVSADRARNALGWRPEESRTLIWDVAFGSYAV